MKEVGPIEGQPIYGALVGTSGQTHDDRVALLVQIPLLRGLTLGNDTISTVIGDLPPCPHSQGSPDRATNRYREHVETRHRNQPGSVN